MVTEAGFTSQGPGIWESQRGLLTPSDVQPLELGEPVPLCPCVDAAPGHSHRASEYRVPPGDQARAHEMAADSRALVSDNFHLGSSQQSSPSSSSTEAASGNSSHL